MNESMNFHLRQMGSGKLGGGRLYSSHVVTHCTYCAKKNGFKNMDTLLYLTKGFP